MVTTGPLSHTDDDRPMSPDSSFVICLSADTRGAALEDDQQSPETAGAAPDEDVVEEPINEQSLAPTVIMRSPTVSAVVAAVKTGKKTTSAATAPTPTSRLTKVPKKARTGTPTVETLRQKRSSGHADRGNVVVTAEKPATAAAVVTATVSPGSGTEENKAPSPGRSKNPVGLPSLNRAKTASAQPASCGKQAAPATTTTTTRTSPPAAAAPLGLKRAAPATSSQSPVGLGGGALPLPPSKRARTSSTSPTVTDALTEHGLKRKSLRTSFAAPDSKQQQQQDIPLNNAKTTTAAATIAAQPQRESRRQRTASTKKSTTRVPAWVQKAAEAPHVNALLLSAVEKVKPSRGCGGNGAYPAWNIAGEMLRGRIRQNFNVEDPSNNEGSTRKRRKRPDDEILDTTAVTATATATADVAADTTVDVNGIERFKTKTRFIPGWEAVLQTVDVAPREFEESETVAELLVHGEHKRLKYNIHRDYTLLKNSTNKSEYSSPGSPGMLTGTSTGALTRADGSLYRQGFGISEFAARMSLVASGLTEDAAAKESFVQRAKRIISNNQTTGTIPAAAAVANNNGGTSAGSRLREATAEKTKKSKNASLSSALKPEDRQKERAAFALGHAISNAVALAKRTGRVVSFNNNNPRSRKNGSVARKSGSKPRNGNNTHNGRSGGGGGGGGRRSKGGAGTSSRLRNTVTSLETDPATGTATLSLLTTTTTGNRITAPPKVWPPLDIQFISKGEKAGNSINVNDVSRSNKFSGSGLDTKLWNKLYKEKAQANK